jgi:putative FmdB family regulatory protein
MPIYEYRCQACRCKFDRYVASMNEVTDEMTCPECGGSDVQRLISAPAVHLGDSSRGERDGDEATTAETPVFGRKELNDALARRQEWASE